MYETADSEQSKQTAIEIGFYANAAPSMRTPEKHLKASGVLDYTISLLFNSTSVSVSIKVKEYNATFSINPR